MKITKTYLSAILALSMLFATSCGSEEAATTEGTSSEATPETPEAPPVPTYEDLCTAGNDVFVQVENYDYGLTAPFSTNGKFEVKRSQWMYKTDSTAELKLYNYELGSEDPGNFEIVIGLTAKNGEVLKAENYPYQDWENSFWSKVNIISASGTVWFNWVSGMPDQGVVKINHVDAEGVCGEFMLEVNMPDNTTIGHVVLNGSFAHHN